LQDLPVEPEASRYTKKNCADNGTEWRRLTSAPRHVEKKQPMSTMSGRVEKKKMSGSNERSVEQTPSLHAVTHVIKNSGGAVTRPHTQKTTLK
jgi:tRNA(Arg) A34 adenosine deaminase TadA